MAEVLDPEQLDTKDRYPRTYALKLELMCPTYKTVDATFYKFGLSGMSVASRFRREPPNLRITIMKVWKHETTAEAKAHEAKLFKRYRPTCLFDAWPPCPANLGPLSSARGNTELFLANRLNGDKDIKLAHATFWEDYAFSGHIGYKRAYVPSDIPLYHGKGHPGWLDWLRDVPDGYVFLPQVSSAKNKLIFVRQNYLFDFQDFAASDKKREEYRDQAEWVTTFDQAESLAGIYPRFDK